MSTQVSLLDQFSHQVYHFQDYRCDLLVIPHESDAYLELNLDSGYCVTLTSELLEPKGYCLPNFLTMLDIAYDEGCEMYDFQFERREDEIRMILTCISTGYCMVTIDFQKK